MPAQLTVDLRSDTVTRPTAAVRAAMAAAEVGDDVYGEDPTVNALEQRVAAMLGHEAAVLMPSGTMANLVALMLSAAPGTEVLAVDDAHIVTWELGGLAALGGIQTRTVAGARGVLEPAIVAPRLRPAGPAFGPVATAVLAVEQTHNGGGGTITPLATLTELRAVSSAAGARLHVDGARLWNAHVATGVPLATWGGLADTLAVCLSKGLGAPAGSLTVCSVADAARARVLRKRLGGGMRQAGVLAAAGLHVLEHHLEGLAEDHRRARVLAQALDVPSPETNMVMLDVPDPLAVQTAAAEQGVRVGAYGATRLRLVTHLDVDDEQLAHAVRVLRPLVLRPAAQGG